MEAAQNSRPSLGEIFVDRGLITEADLERALAEQDATKQRLADILVRRGLVTGRDITDALTAQLASLQSTISNDASAASTEPSTPDHAWDDSPEGPPELDEEPLLAAVVNFWNEPEPPADGPAATAIDSPEAPDAPPTVGDDSIAFDPQILIDETEERRKKMEARLAALGPLLQGVDQVQSNLAAHDLCSPLLAHELGATQERLVAQGDALANEIAGLKQLRDDIARNSALLEDLRVQLEGKVHELAELKATAAIWNDKVSNLEHEVDNLTESANQAARDLNALAAASPPTPAVDAATETYGPTHALASLSTEPSSSADGHLLFVPNDEGYELLECDGGAPEVGQAVDIQDQAWVVTKIGPSPLPYDERLCAFLTTAA